MGPREALAQQIAHAVLACAIPLFPRHRWLNSSEAFRLATLLFVVCGIGQRAVLAWAAASLPQQSSDRANVADSAGDSVVVAGGAEPDGPAELPAPSPQTWAERQADMRRKACVWAESEPGLRLMVMCVTMQPQLNLYCRLFRLGSSQWDFDQLHQHAKDNVPVSFRALTVHRRSITEAFFVDARATLESADVWDVLPASSRSQELMSLAFRMVSRAAGGVFLLLHSRHGGFPWKLFELLGADADARAALAAEIACAPACLCDPFTLAFRGHFPSAEMLCSADAQAALTATALLTRTDTCRVECRHAAVRRLRIMRSMTHCQAFADASASFVLRRQRILEKDSWQSIARRERVAREGSQPELERAPQQTPKRKRPPAWQRSHDTGDSSVDCRPPKVRRHSVGPWRAFWHDYAQRPGAEPSCSSMWDIEQCAAGRAEYHRIKDQAGQEWNRL